MIAVEPWEFRRWRVFALTFAWSPENQQPKGKTPKARGVLWDFKQELRVIDRIEFEARIITKSLGFSAIIIEYYTQDPVHERPLYVPAVAAPFCSTSNS